MDGDNPRGAGNQQGRLDRHGHGVQEPSEAIRQTPHLTRQQAIALDEKKYHGRPCKRCGGTERYVKGGCTACVGPLARERYKRRRREGHEFVYECYSSQGELLYIGRTNHPMNRIYTHRQETPWWREVVRMVWLQVPDVERQRIRDKRPKYNKHGAR